MKITKTLFTLLLFIIFCFQQTNAITKCVCQKLYEITKYTKEGVRFGYINCKGKVIVEPKFLMVSDFNDGVGVVNIESNIVGEKEDGRPVWGGTDGIVDIRGNLIVVPDSSIFPYFSEGFALARIKGKLAYVDKSGNIAISIPDDVKIYEEDYGTPEKFPFTDGFAGLYAVGGGYYLVDKQGNFTRHKEPYYFYDKNGLAVIELENKYAIVDNKGNYIFGPQDSNINGSNGIYFTVPKDKNEKYKFINSKGEIIFEAFFDYVGSFSEGLAKVEVNGKWGYINEQGKLIISATFDDAEDFSEGLAAVKIKGKWGFIDKKGRFVIHPKFDAVSYESFDCGLARVQLNETYGYIDKKGIWVWKEKVNKN